MILYHGTSARHVAGILKNGIVPRSKSGQTNWPGEYESDASMVYLTSCYALHFALAAERGAAEIAVLEIDAGGLVERKLHPDEDFVGQGLVHANGVGLAEAQNEALANRSRYKHLWKDSLAKMGTVAYRGTVPARLVKRVAYVDVGVRALLLSGIDPVIAPINFMFKGGYYREFTEWLFGDRAHLPDVAETERMEAAGCVIPGRLDHIKAESADRRGIRVEKAEGRL